MVHTLNIIHFAYPRFPEELRDERKGLAWLRAMADQRWRLTQDSENFYNEGYREALQAHDAGSVSAATKERLQAFTAGKEEVFECAGFWLVDDLWIDMALGYGEATVFLSADGGSFSHMDEGHQQKYEAWMRLSEVIYQVWRPIFGFDSAGLVEPHTSRDDALALEARCLYLVNYYGPEFVAKLGRERLLSAPAWRVKPLDDGGIMLAPNPIVSDDPFTPRPYGLKQVAQHLGLYQPLK